MCKLILTDFICAYKCVCVCMLILTYFMCEYKCVCVRFSYQGEEVESLKNVTLLKSHPLYIMLFCVAGG